MLSKKLVDKIGFIGIVIMQLNSIPAIIQAKETGLAAPVLSITMTLTGYICYLIIESYYKQWLYVFGSTCGLIGNMLLLFFVIYY